MTIRLCIIFVVVFGSLIFSPIFIPSRCDSCTNGATTMSYMSQDTWRDVVGIRCSPLIVFDDIPCMCMCVHKINAHTTQRSREPCSLSHGYSMSGSPIVPSITYLICYTQNISIKLLLWTYYKALRCGAHLMAILSLVGPIHPSTIR